MFVYVLFFISLSNASFTYEFKDNGQCLNSLNNMSLHFGGRGYCQQVLK